MNKKVFPNKILVTPDRLVGIDCSKGKGKDKTVKMTWKKMGDKYYLIKREILDG